MKMTNVIAIPHQIQQIVVVVDVIVDVDIVVGRTEHSWISKAIAALSYYVNVWVACSG